MMMVHLFYCTWDSPSQKIITCCEPLTSFSPIKFCQLTKPRSRSCINNQCWNRREMRIYGPEPEWGVLSSTHIQWTLEWCRNEADSKSFALRDQIWLDCVICRKMTLVDDWKSYPPLNSIFCWIFYIELIEGNWIKRKSHMFRTRLTVFTQIKVFLRGWVLTPGLLTQAEIDNFIFNVKIQYWLHGWLVVWTVVTPVSAVPSVLGSNSTLENTFLIHKTFFWEFQAFIVFISYMFLHFLAIQDVNS